MIRRIRRFIFYIFLILFVILTLVIILYAQGYSFDWQTKSLVVTGAFYFKSHPKEANIYINNEYRGETSKFIKRLVPKEYDVKISKPDYYDWEKTLKISSKLVTEAKNILLVKKNTVKTLTAENVKYFSTSNDQKKIIYLTDKTAKEIDPAQQKIADPREIPAYSQFSLRLISLDDNTDIQIYPSLLAKNGRLIPSLPNLNTLLDIFWFPNNKKILLSFSNDRYYILDLENQSKVTDLNNLIKASSNYKIYSIKNLSFHPQDSNKLFFLANNNLFITDLTNDGKLPASIISDISAYTIYNNEILYVKYPNFYKRNLEGLSFKKIFDIPFFEPKQTITIVDDNALIINNDLYLFNSQTQVLEKIAENVKEINFSKNEKKLLWRTENEIGVIWFEKNSEQPFRKKYEIEIVMKALVEINQAIWHLKTNEHIIFVVDNTIKITELDGRDKKNTVDIFIDLPTQTGENLQIFYNEKNEKLYVLSKEKLFELKFTE